MCDFGVLFNKIGHLESYGISQTQYMAFGLYVRKIAIIFHPVDDQCCSLFQQNTSLPYPISRLLIATMTTKIIVLVAWLKLCLADIELTHKVEMGKDEGWPVVSRHKYNRTVIIRGTVHEGPPRVHVYNAEFFSPGDYCLSSFNPSQWWEASHKSKFVKF